MTTMTAVAISTVAAMPTIVQLGGLGTVVVLPGRPDSSSRCCDWGMVTTVLRVVVVVHIVIESALTALTAVATVVIIAIVVLLVSIVLLVAVVLVIAVILILLVSVVVVLVVVTTVVVRRRWGVVASMGIGTAREGVVLFGALGSTAVGHTIVNLAKHVLGGLGSLAATLPANSGEE